MVALAAAMALIRPALAQEDPSGWNSSSVLELVRRGQVRRLQPLQDSSLQRYQARSDGYVHFFLERKDGGDPIPLRVDQVSVDLYWMAPDRAKQVVRAQRLEKLMPIKDFYYYIDRLTVIQNGFGNEIQVGEGRDVQGVLHPLAVGAEEFYDYRLADSVTLTLQGSPDPIRVYEVEVNPRNPQAPGFIGAIFLDRATASIVRLSFTFTPASYVDRRNDQVRITLEHGLWDMRFWLPYRQRVEVRREIPEFDFGVVSVIKAELTVGEYDFEAELDERLFGGRPVVYDADWAQDTTRFRGGLYDGMEAVGLSIPEAGLPSLEELEAEARRLVRDQVLGGLPPLRPWASGASSVIRADRSEGLFLGAGLSYAVSDRSSLRLQAGYAAGARQGLTAASLDRSDADGRGGWRVDGFWNDPRDLEPLPGSSGAVSTLATLFSGRDYRDLYFTRGARIGRRKDLGSGGSLEVSVEGARHDSATGVWTASPLGGGATLRPVLAVEEGTRLAGRLEWDRRGIDLGSWTGRARIAVEGGSWEGSAFGRALASYFLLHLSKDRKARARLGLEGGGNVGAVPPQHLFLLGGRHVLPGHPYRGYAGSAFVRVAGSVGYTLLPTWLGVRGFGAVAATRGLEDNRPEGWRVEGTEGLRGGLGVGVEVLHGVLRFDVGFGLGTGGRTEFIFSVSESLWGFL